MDRKELERLEESCNTYMDYCWGVYNKAKALEPGNSFVKSVGAGLFKYRKLSIKQLDSLFTLIEKYEKKHSVVQLELPFDKI